MFQPSPSQLPIALALMRLHVTIFQYPIHFISHYKDKLVLREAIVRIHLLTMEIHSLRNLQAALLSILLALQLTLSLSSFRQADGVLRRV